ncbi:Superfamily II DNA or RNA helicase, SNF2 family [Chryseobacterium arachidis]|uniref:Superfamily II DNA or RNA helicase, SNF2 family n=1 Tax=Chryseobacterium arachidis TaxID=1416778 RepID=A0A1M5L2D9_9FLAO|nr:DEAD/DEAH box helicase [Chryseobacterium arachidis]SHG59282.1 Superfamily II DNA or RNA helicase, SNF2 family [Chryseobacterium arachidis]
MKLPKEYILPDANITTLSVYDLLKHTQNAGFIENKDFKEIYPLTLECNAGVFTKSISTIDYPNVSVSQVGSSLMTACSCDNESQKLCEHQTEIIHAIIEQKNFRIFFDHHLRQRTLLVAAKGFGLENEPHLDAYFQLEYKDGKLDIQPKIKELVRMDEEVFKQELLPQQPSILEEMAAQDTAREKILVIGRHRFYNQLNFSLMEADLTKNGKIKNPITGVDPMNLIWKAEQPSEIKFYTAIVTFQTKFSEDKSPAEIKALQLIAQNPLELAVYYHDHTISETVSPKSLVSVQLGILKAEIQLSVFKKNPFYEITGELQLNDASIPFKNIILRNEQFVYHQNTLHLIDNPDLLRVIRFFKSNNEILIIHKSKYDEFLKTVLSSLEQYIHINYSYIRKATPVELAEKSFQTERIIYLQQKGNYISLTPVMKYGSIEVAVYSRKQLSDTDQNGNEFRVERNIPAEDQFTSIMMQQHKDFKEQLGGYEYFYLHKDKFLDDNWFLEAFEAWRNEGITILGFNELKSTTINSHRAKINIVVTSGVDWFNAKLSVRFGKKEATLKQLHKAIRNKAKFVQLDDGSQGILPDEWIEKITRYFQVGDIDEELLKIPKINFTEISGLFEKEILSEEMHEELTNYAQQFSDIKKIPEIPVPAELNAHLRDYQREGLNWLAHLDQFNFGGCLADDMGLGKTLQIIAFILYQREKYGGTTNLIVVPTSLLFNWQQEIEKFAPSIKILLHYGTNRKKNIDEMHRYEVVLISYGMLLSDIQFLKKFNFNYIFLDESQTIKNPNSEKYKAARLLQSRNKIVLTGTPVENNTFDLYGQLSFACPGLLGSKQYFKDAYAIPIDKFEYTKRAVKLQQKIKPFILRRTKKQVAKELPEKTEMVIYCEMNSEQRAVYDTYEQELRDYISGSSDDETLKNKIHVLAGLTKLRQICNSPVLLKEGHSNEHAVKIEILTDQIENKSKEHKILVFSQFVEMLDLIKEELIRKNIPFEYLTGQTKDRGSKVNNFQNNENIRVFLISLKAGGTGLNLTEADYVYLVDPWWNPASENQAIDRSYRIGQTKNVIAVRLICKDTIEEKIMNLQKKKSKLVENLIKTNASAWQGFTKNDLLEILDA